MVDKGIGDYFISDADDDSLDDEVLAAPVVIPAAPARRPLHLRLPPLCPRRCP